MWQEKELRRKYSHVDSGRGEVRKEVDVGTGRVDKEVNLRRGVSKEVNLRTGRVDKDVNQSRGGVGKEVDVERSRVRNSVYVYM